MTIISLSTTIYSVMPIVDSIYLSVYYPIHPSIHPSKYIYINHLLIYLSCSEFLLSLDQWLHERHNIPFINIDLIFATGSGRYGTVGDIQQNVLNPLHSTRTKPLEDTLLISIDNPVFSDNKS